MSLEKLMSLILIVLKKKLDFFLLLYHCVHVHKHAYYNHRHTDISPLKLRKNCNQISLALIRSYLLSLHIWSYPPYFSRGPWLALPLLAAPYPKTRCEREIGTKDLSDKPLVSLLTGVLQTFQRQRETPVPLSVSKWNVSFSRWEVGGIQICLLVSTRAASEILTDTTLLKTLYFQHWSLLHLLQHYCIYR